MKKLRNKILAIFKQPSNKKALEKIPLYLRIKLIDEGYVQGAKKQREIDLEIIDKAIASCSMIECWSEAARRARSEIAGQVKI